MWFWLTEIHAADVLVLLFEIFPVFNCVVFVVKIIFCGCLRGMIDWLIMCCG